MRSGNMERPAGADGSGVSPMGTLTAISFTIPQFFLAFISAAGIPAAVVGFCVWMMQQKILKRDKQREEDNLRYRKEREQREKNREQFEINLLEQINATMALSEATAKAVQRIPDAHCNGDMHKALEYAAETKKKQKQFLTEKGIQAIM